MVSPIGWPRCPQRQDFSVIAGFITPGSDLPPPHGLNAGISVDVTDPTENHERVRVIEKDSPWDLQVKWCVCGPFADMLGGCWCVQVFIDDIDGKGPTSGLIGSARVDASTGVIIPGKNDDTTKRCFEHTFNFLAGQVGAGVYDVVVVITLAMDSCQKPGAVVPDMLGYAEIPVLVFFDEDAPFCPG
jgi:hypothetical protein